MKVFKLLTMRMTLDGAITFGLIRSYSFLTEYAAGEGDLVKHVAVPL